MSVRKNFGRRYWLSTRARVCVCVSLRLPVDGLEEPLGKAAQLLNRSLAFVLQPAVLLGQPTDGMLEWSSAALLSQNPIRKLGHLALQLRQAVTVLHHGLLLVAVAGGASTSSRDRRDRAWGGGELGEDRRSGAILKRWDLQRILLLLLLLLLNYSVQHLVDVVVVHVTLRVGLGGGFGQLKEKELFSI